MKKFLFHSFNQQISSHTQTHLPSLDGVRGTAFIFVLIAHISNYYDLLFKGLGKVGVWLFFVLSAFLLSNYFISKPQKIYIPSEWANYFLRRLLRIFPLYILVLCIYYFNKFLITEPNSIIQHLFLQAGSGHFWTISVEVKYYLILPIVVFFLTYILKANPLWSLLGLLVFMSVHEYFFPASQSTISTISILTYITVFISGSVAAVIHNKLNTLQLSRTIERIFEILGMLALLAIVLTIPAVWSKLCYPVSSVYFYRDFNFFGLLCSTLIICVLHSNGLIRKIFENKILRFCGKISYSGYLIHPIILNTVYMSILKNYLLISVFAMLLITILTATIMYYYIERPCMSINLSKVKDLNMLKKLRRLN